MCNKREIYCFQANWGQLRIQSDIEIEKTIEFMHNTKQVPEHLLRCMKFLGKILKLKTGKHCRL